MRWKRGKELTEDDLVNEWLGRFHNTSIDEVLKKHKDWDIKSKDWNSSTFYKEYQVTQEQCNEWESWVVDEIYKRSYLSKKEIKRGLWSVTLNTAPMIKEDKIN